ncbi:MAG: hypothetical protein R3E98_05045 [Gemmatimonadota bacterium]|nr:hypothetical protein [Gemmatimonadota bacterium]
MLQRSIAAAVLAIVALPLAVAAQTSDLTVGTSFGYQDGVGTRLFAVRGNVAEGLPVLVRGELGYVATDPGSAPNARRIFINNATNGTPASSGRTLDAAFDVLLRTSRFGVPRAYWYAGVRYARFKGNFKYIGGNEDFDVVSNHWGLGAGVQSFHAMTPRLDLVLTGGLEVFRSARLTGHDTSYAPGDENVNAREDYTYGDADEAIHQPKLRPVLSVGFGYRMGPR